MFLFVPESTGGDDLRAEARQMGTAVQPDPEPKRNAFIRSDQYNFILLGIPSVRHGSLRKSQAAARRRIRRD